MQAHALEITKIEAKENPKQGKLIGVLQVF